MQKRPAPDGELDSAPQSKKQKPAAPAPPPPTSSSTGVSSNWKNLAKNLNINLDKKKAHKNTASASAQRYGAQNTRKDLYVVETATTNSMGWMIHFPATLTIVYR